MFCPKCGRENTDNASYCIGCGEKINGEKKMPEISGVSFNRVIKRMDTIKGSEKILFGAIIALVISMFFLGAEMFRISYTVLWSTQNTGFTLFEEQNGLKTIFVLGYLVAVIAMLLPFLTTGGWEKKHFVAGILMPIISLVMFVIVAVSASGKMETLLGGSLMDAAQVNFSLTAGAWIFLALTVVTEVLVVKASTDVVGAWQYWDRVAEREHKKQEIPVMIKTESVAQGTIPTWKRVQMESEARQSQEQEQE